MNRRSRSRALPLAIGALALLQFLPVQGIEVALHYRERPTASEEQEEEQFWPWGYAFLAERGRTPPAGEWKLPEFKGKTQLYAEVQLGDRKHLLVLAQEELPFFDRLYLDANCNRDLTDDPVVKGENTEGGQAEPFRFQTFPPVKLSIQVGGKQCPYVFQLQTHCFLAEPDKPWTADANWENVNVILQPDCAYQGTLEHEGTTYQVWLGDQNGNGRFQDPPSIMEVDSWNGALYFQGDRIFLTEKPKVEQRDGALFGKQLLLRDELFEVAFDQAAAKLVLTPYAAPTGTLKLSHEPRWLMLEGRAGAPSVIMFQPGAAGRVPAGEYRLLEYQLQRPDAEGDNWLLACVATKETAIVTVKADAEAELAFGEPFTPRVDTLQYPKEMWQDEKVPETRLMFSVVGRAGEVVDDLARIEGEKTRLEMSKEDPNRPKEPAYRIVKADGELLAQGDFEYG